MNHYQRSNVESTFSMIKGKFRDHLRSKTDVAMINETLCKIICHNLCCLIHSIYELEIQAMFWDKEPKAVEVETNGQLETTDETVEAMAWI